MAATKKSKQPTSLYDSFMAMLRPFYSELIAQELARGHCEAHKQFLHELYLHGEKHNKVKKLLPNGKPVVRIRRKRSHIVQSTNELFGRSKVIHRRSPTAVMDDVKREVLSFLDSAQIPVPMLDIFSACGTFGWSMAQIKRAVRELRESNMVVQEGIKKFAVYRLVPKPAEETPVEPAAATEGA